MTTDLKRVWIICCFLILMGLTAGEPAAAASFNPAVIKPGVAQALTTQPKVRVLVKLREPSGISTSRRTRQSRIADLQARFSASFEGEMRSGDITISRRMERIPWISAQISGKAFDKLRNHQQVAVIEEDIPIYALLAESGPQIKADRSFHTGYTGLGINVAVLDTGIDTDHPDLQNSVVWQECFLSDDPCPLTGTSRASGPGSAEDNQGHGSHVSGIITSDNEIYRGIAPDAGIVAIKVLNNSGSGTLSDLVAALDWVAVNHSIYNIRVVNMSLGSSVYGGDCDEVYQVMAEATDAVKNAGVAIFAASGNDASEYGIDMPACLSSVISVGAVYDADVGERSYPQICSDTTTAQDQIACFSNVSTVLDLLAPGARIISTQRNGGTISESGTSMAAPHAAGMAALLLENDPTLTPDDLLTLMADTGTQLYDDRIGQWISRIDIAAALGIDISSDFFFYDFGYVAPYQHSPPKQLTLTNTGTEDILLGIISLNGDHPSDFHLITDNCSNQILPGGGHCNITAQFSPTTNGTRRAEITIPTDEPEAPQLAIELKGWSGKVYYVNDPFTTNDIWCTTPGNDSNDGLTPDTPKASVQSVLADYDLEPGDVVRIDTGLYILDSNIEITSQDEGDANQPVTFTASPYGVLFDRGNQTLGNYPWYFTQCDYVTLTTIDDDTYPSVPKSWMEVVGGFSGISLSWSNHIDISRVTAHRNGYRGIIANQSENCRFTHNLIFDNRYYGLTLSSCDNAYISNNTVIGDSIHAVLLDGSSRDAVFTNNIILAPVNGSHCLYIGDAANLVTSDYNLLLPTNGASIGYFRYFFSDLAQWQTTTGLDTNSISTDPMFVDQLLSDYHLSLTSPAIDAGDPASDYTLEPQPNGYRINMGAYGGTPEAKVSFIGDFDGDGDVDGEDLLSYAIGDIFDGIQYFTKDYGDSR